MNGDSLDCEAPEAGTENQLWRDRREPDDTRVVLTEIADGIRVLASR